MQISARERSRLLLPNDLLVALWLQLGEFFGKVGIRGEDWCSGRGLMNDVCKWGVGCTILLEEI